MSPSIFHKAKSKGPLYALFLNCTLKQSPETSNTEALCNLLIVSAVSQSSLGKAA